MFVVQDSIRLTVYNPWPAGFQILRTQLDDFMDLVTELTNGYLTFEPKFGWTDSISKASSEGQAYSFADYYLAGQIPAMQYLTSFPTILPSAEAFAAWRTSKRGRSFVNALMSEQGVWSCTMQDTTRQDAYIMAPGKTLPTTVKEMSGFTIRAPGVGGKLFARLGATVVSLSGDQLKGALTSGSVDMVEWVAMTNFDAMGFQDVQGITLVTPGLHEQHGAVSFGIGLDVYNAFPDNIKHALDAACDAQLSRSISESVYDNAHFNEKHKAIPRARWSDEIIRAYEMEARKYIDERLKNSPSKIEKEMLTDMLRFDAAWRSLKNAQVHALEFDQFPPLPPHSPPSPPLPPPVPPQLPLPPSTPLPPMTATSPSAPPAPPYPPAPPGVPRWQ